MSELQDSLEDVQYLTPNDPYHYTVDNRPLRNLDNNIQKIAEAIDSAPDPFEALDDKVDKVVGKQLSDENYTAEDKIKVFEIADKVDKVDGKQLSDENYTQQDKEHVLNLGTASTLDTPEDDALYGLQNGSFVDISDLGSNKVTTLTHPNNISSVDEEWSPTSSSDIPMHLAKNQRHVFENPYGSSPVMVKIFVRSVSEGLTEWFDPCWIYGSSGSSGVRTGTLGLSKIVVTTGVVSLISKSSSSGSSANKTSSGNSPSDLQVMVQVIKI